ncbi:UNVERIFIED_CONTAM: hypothetical protein Scaly_2187100 [Sesamum calycinum]|uniref:DDE Tnp4 domain-containing protein n=1 Tax=Sesamum calycinum TaxID=2727403 RepID=A0AAW2MQP7_9LAMI
MHEEFVSHRLQSSTFSPSVWARITDRMNSAFCPSYVFTQEQLKGKLNRMCRAWCLLNGLLHKETGWGWDHEQNTITDESGRLEELCREHRNRWHCTIVRTSTPKVPDRIFRSKRPTKCGVSELHSKKCGTMDKLNESLQEKIDRTGQKATESIECCVDELTKFKDLSDCVFTTALERFHSHSTRTIFLRLDDENKLRWLYSLGKTMASASEGAADETNSSSGTPGTPGTPGSTELDVPEEFYAFQDLICPELFREKVSCNTSALQGEGLVAKIMATPHTGRGLLPHGQTSRVSSIEVVALFMQMVGMHKRQCDNMERFQHSLETINRRFDRVFSTLCAMAPELITRPNFTDTHSRVASNIDFYPEFKDCVGVMDGTLVPAWVPQIYQNRYRSRKGRLSQNVLAICDFDMNFTYVYAGWESSAADARALNHVVSQDPTFPFSPIDQ